MIIRKLSLTNFRNYGRLDIEVGPSVNVIYGNNAQGKTNIIEAISVGSSVFSHRTSKDRELIKFGENEYVIDLLCHDEVYDSDVELQASYLTEKSSLNSRKTPGRRLMHDGMPISKLSSYIGVCNTVIFAPEDLNLSFRGRFDKSRENELEYWDFSLAELSAEMIINRYRYCRMVSDKAAAHHSVISDGKEVLKVEYSTISGSEGVIRGILTTDDMFDLFIQGTLSEGILAQIKGALSDHILSRLRSERLSDIEKGIITNGVHRDDLEISLNGLSMRQYSSQGQQRSAALSLKLAELEIIREKTRSSPILLLDDVFSELDEGRRVSLLSGMNIAQIFITCTDRSFVEGELSGLVTSEGDRRFFRVEAGTVYPE